MPAVVVEATAIVMVEVPEPGAAMDVGLKLTVTPVGWPDADKAIAELKPPETAVVIVDVPLLPSTTETEVGEAEMVKAGTGAEVTVSETEVVSVVLPEVPVTVMLYVPVAVVEATVSVMVEVPVPVIEAGLKPTVTPVGWPLALKVTAESNPPVAVLVMVDVPELPCTTETEVGEAERVKPTTGAAVTVSETEVVFVVLPEVPVTVMVYVPVAVVEATVNVAVEVPAPVIEVGLKPTVTPVGWPLAVNATAESKPPVTELVMVDVPELPWTTETEVGEAERVKLGVAVPESAVISPAVGLPHPVTRS